MLNDWYAWEQSGKNNGAISGNACEHYTRFREDFALSQQLGYNSHRLSIEWSRIEPQPGEWNEKEIEHYREVLHDLKQKNTFTMVTLWHFTLPQWFQQQGGWLQHHAVSMFVAYVEKIAAALGDLVDHWITINEPNVYIGQSYVSGVWPPGHKSKRESFVMFRKMVQAHKRAYSAIHRICDTINKRASVGTANNIQTFESYRKHSIRDAIYIWAADNILNHQFIWWTKKYHDFIGVNYYFHHRLALKPQKLFELMSQATIETREVSDVGWEINPQGIFDALLDMSRYNKPIYITENGIASTDDGKRIRTIIAVIKEIYHAIQAGVDVKGYFHWALLDNFEWEKGFKPRFGLIEVDYTTQKRTPRHSAQIYGQIAKQNGLPHELLRYLGHGIE